MNTECEMISIERAKEMLGYEPSHTERVLLSIINDREIAYARLLADNDSLRREYELFREEFAAISTSHRIEINELRERLEGSMRDVFDKQTKALERIAENTNLIARKV